MKTTLLIDGDILLYVLCHQHHKEVELDEILCPSLDLRAALQSADTMLADMRDHFGADGVVLAFSYKGLHWRKDLDPNYKVSRKLLDRVAKPLGYWTMRNYLREQYPSEVWPPLEADDILGILATEPHKGRRVVVSQDKDLKSVPGYYASDWDSDVVVISEEEADRFHMFQTLMGDPTDGYKGCPGLGKVRAKKIVEPLSDLHDLWAAVVVAYEKAGLTADDALTQARVARILRHGEYDKKKQKVKLWEPPR